MRQRITCSALFSPSYCIAETKRLVRVRGGVTIIRQQGDYASVASTSNNSVRAKRNSGRKGSPVNIS